MWFAPAINTRPQGGRNPLVGRDGAWISWLLKKKEEKKCLGSYQLRRYEGSLPVMGYLLIGLQMDHWAG